ncbi:hypothetical protein Tco_0918369 [Tanacetum coccineum]
MMERCVVCGPGFVKFKLSRKWIVKSIQKMLTHEALAHMLEYSGVVVLPKSIHDGDHLDVNYVEIKVHAVGLAI